MFYRKKIEDLENRLAVLEFRQEANGRKFIITESPSYIFPFPQKSYTIKFLSENGAKVITIQESFPVYWIITQNDKYLEFWSDKSTYKRCVIRAMRVFEDKLVNMDVDVYNKAFYPKKENPYSIPKFNIEAETKKASDALDALTYLVGTRLRDDIITKSITKS